MSGRTKRPVSGFTWRLVRFVHDQELWKPGARVLVAVSGGPDSCALLLSLVEAAHAHLLPFPAGVAHFHHGVRGQDADEEAAFVAGLCAKYALPCVIGLGRVPSHGGHYQSDVARRHRYDFLREAAEDLNADTLATAHTLSDQAETVLWRVMRGTGLEGLAGIPLRRQLPEPTAATLTLVRPLLSTSRAEVEAYCHAQNIAPRHDPSNDETYYARVQVRRTLPFLADRFNPRLPEALARLADTARTDDDLLQTLATQVWDECNRETPEEPVVFLAVEPLQKAHPALRRRVLLRGIRKAFRLAGASAEEAASAETLARLEQMLRDNKSVAELPGKLHAEYQSGLLSLRVGALPTLPVPSAASSLLALPIPGQVYYSPTSLTIRAETVSLGPDAPPVIRTRGSLTVDIALPVDYEDCLDVRGARAGDRIAPLGMGGKTRLVRDVLKEAHVPVNMRDSAPLVARADTGEILWVIGRTQAESTRITENTDKRLRLQAYRPTNLPPQE